VHKIESPQKGCFSQKKTTPFVDVMSNHRTGLAEKNVFIEALEIQPQYFSYAVLQYVA